MIDNKNEKNLLNEHKIYLLNQYKKFALGELISRDLLFIVVSLGIAFPSKKAWAHQAKPPVYTITTCSFNKEVPKTRVIWSDSLNNEKSSKHLDHEWRRNVLGKTQLNSVSSLPTDEITLETSEIEELKINFDSYNNCEKFFTKKNNWH